MTPPGHHPQVPSFEMRVSVLLFQKKEPPQNRSQEEALSLSCDPTPILSQRVSTTVEMPLAHPISTTTSSNFGPEPFLVVKCITADPGEAFADFSYRTEHPDKTQWSQRGDSEHKTELSFDRNSSARLVDMLSEYLRD